MLTLEQLAAASSEEECFKRLDRHSHRPNAGDKHDYHEGYQTKEPADDCRVGSICLLDAMMACWLLPVGAIEHPTSTR